MKTTKIQFCVFPALVSTMWWISSFAAAQSATPEQPFGSELRAELQAEEILKACDVKGGVIVHIGCGDGRLSAALRANESYLVHGLDPSQSNVQRARQYLQSLGVYGAVSVDKLRGDSLPYI
ncbi:MAG: class I SAM-dependent methyltransferase, partial [Planctomycetota bacterium]